MTMKGKTRMKRTFLLLIFGLTLVLSSCGSTDVVLDVNYEGDSSSSVYTSKDINEFHAIMYPDDYPENPFDIESEVREIAESKLGKYDKESGTIECTVSAPDVYAFLMDNQETFVELNDEDLYKTIHDAIQNKELGTRKVKITLSVQEVNGAVIANTDSDEYRDAVSGGMYSALSDIYASILSDVLEAQK